MLLVLVVQVVQEHPVQAPVQMVLLVVTHLSDLPDHLILVNRIMFLVKVVVEEDGEHLLLQLQLQSQVYLEDLVEEHLHMMEMAEREHNPEQIQHSLITVTLVVIIQMQLDIHLEVAVLELQLKDQLQAH